MRFALLVSGALAFGTAPCLAATVAMAPPSGQPYSVQASNIDGVDTGSRIAPSLPTPDVALGAGPLDFLNAARHDLRAGRSGAAQSALEMAETRVLDRSVVQGNGGLPDQSAPVLAINAALHALAANDIPGAVQNARAAAADLSQAASQPAATQPVATRPTAWGVIGWSIPD